MIKFFILRVVRSASLTAPNPDGGGVAVGGGVGATGAGETVSGVTVDGVEVAAPALGSVGLAAAGCSGLLATGEFAEGESEAGAPETGASVFDLESPDGFSKFIKITAIRIKRTPEITMIGARLFANLFECLKACLQSSTESGHLNLARSNACLNVQSPSHNSEAALKRNRLLHSF
jgi:hypothetical protein